MRITSIKKRQDFIRISKSQNKFITPNLILIVDKTNIAATDNSLRVGFTVSKKIGNAIKRNKVKRRLRAAAREIMPKIAKTSYDYIIIARSQTFYSKFQDILTDLTKSVNICMSNI